MVTANHLSACIIPAIYHVTLLKLDCQEETEYFLKANITSRFSGHETVRTLLKMLEWRVTCKDILILSHEQIEMDQGPQIRLKI